MGPSPATKTARADVSPASSSSPPSRLRGLSARYRVLGPIAAGGMGAVYLGRRSDAPADAPPVAIKVLHAGLAADQEMVASFVDEARLASRIRHPNVVGVLDVDLFGDDLVLVLEYVRGVSLHQLMCAASREREPLPMDVALRVVRDVLIGLHAAHEATDDQGQPLHVVHRDVSPQNILVGVDGVARITDFGIAHAAGRLARTRPDDLVVKGKLGYLAPEQLTRKGIDRRVDGFAAGIVLWEALTGETLFPGATEAETLGLLLRRPIPPPSSVAPGVPLALDEVCLRALERDPGRRYPNLLEFARRTEEAAASASHAEVGAYVARLAQEELARHDAARTAPSSPPPARGWGLPSFAESSAPVAPVPAPAAPRWPSRAVVSAGSVAVVGILVGMLAWGALRRPHEEPDGPAPAPPLGDEAPIELAEEEPAPVAPAPSFIEFVEIPVQSPRAASTKARRDGGGKAGAAESAKPPPARPFMPSDL